MNTRTTISNVRTTLPGALSFLAGLCLVGCAALDENGKHTATANTTPGTTTLGANEPASLEPADTTFATNGNQREKFEPEAFEAITPSIAAPSSNVSRVTFSEEGADFDPAISRDGEKLVYASTQHRSTADLYLKRVSSRVVTQLTSGGSDNVMPEISPDGSRVAFCSNRTGNWDVYVMPITGGQPVQITNDLSDDLHPSWSPDGNKLVFCRMGEVTNRWEMWVVDIKNPATTSFIGNGMFPQWCPVAGTGENGTDRIVFQLSRERGNRTFGIWTIDFKDSLASNPTQVTAETETALINPTWSPDGSWIAFAEVGLDSADKTTVTLRNGRKVTSRMPATGMLWMIGADGTGKVALVGGTGAALMPTWASSGSIFFVSNRGGFENIWSLNTNGAVTAARSLGGGSPHVANAHEQAQGTEQESAH